MQRRAVLIVLALLILGALAAGAFLWLRPRRAAPSLASSPGAAPGRPESPATRPAEPTVFLHLALEPAVPVSAGAPVILTVTLSQPPSVARADRSWVSSLRFERADGSAMAWQVRSLGSPRVIDYSRAKGPEAKPADSSPQVPDHFTRARYAIDPDTSAGISPGTYEIRAAAQVGSATLRSNDVRFRMVARAGPASRDELLRLGQFHREAGDFQRAHDIALQLVEATDDADG